MKLKRILALVLCFAMVFGTMSFNVLATEEVTATELPEAVDGVITLEEDVILPKDTRYNDKMNINLNGHTLYVTSCVTFNADTSIYGGKINADDETSSDGIIRVNYKHTEEPVNLTLTNVEVSALNCAYETGVFYVENENNTLTLNNVEVNMSGANDDAGSGVFYCPSSFERGKVILENNTTITTDSTNAIFFATDVDIDGANLVCDNVHRPVFRQAAGTVENSSITINNMDSGRAFVEDVSGNNSGVVNFKNSEIVLPEEIEFVKFSIEGSSATIEDVTIKDENGNDVEVGEDVVIVKNVAKIETNGYPTLQKALDAAYDLGGNVTITFSDDITENVTIREKVDLYLTIDGADKTMNGAITIQSLSDTNDNRRTTIQNINFVDTDDKAGVSFINSVKTNHYPRITVTGCSFTGSGYEEDIDEDVAITIKSAYDAVIKGCTGTGLHSFLQNTAGVKITVQDVTVTDSNGGLAMGTAQNVTVRDCNITSNNYGIRLDAQINTSVTLNGNVVNSYIPVSVRKATAKDYKLSFAGSSSNYTASNKENVWCAICATEYEDGVALNEADGNVKITWNTDVLDDKGVYGAYVWPIDVIFSDGYTKGFDSLSSAMKFGYSGGTPEKIVVHKDITESMTELSGNIITDNPDGVTIKNTIVNDWIYCSEDFTIGEGVTYDATGAASGLFMYADNAVINGTVLTDCYYQRYAGTKLTINEPGSMTVKTETFIVRYMDGDREAGIYIVGDNNYDTIGLNASVIYFYQGMINAKDANIKVGTYWQTNETDGTGSANLVLDNTKMTVTVNEHNFKATGNSSVALTNSSVLTVANSYVIGDNAVMYVDDTSAAYDKTGNQVDFTAGHVAKIGNTYYKTFEAALKAVKDGDTIVLCNKEGSELSKELEFTKDISFTITGYAPEYALPVVTFKNAEVTIKDAEILIPELDARQDATINVVDSIVHDAGGNSIVKSYYNGAINISGASVVYTMQVTTMGYITISDTAKLNATWQTNVYGNGIITVEEGAEFATAALQLTGKDYSGRDNTDSDRVGKPATIVADGATITIGKVYSDNGSEYSYNSSKGINIGTIAGKSAMFDIKNGATVNVFMANGEIANIGADGTVNVDDSAFTFACREADGKVTLSNNGTVNVDGTSDIAANVTGSGWVYMNGVNLDEDTKLYGAKVRFAKGTNNIDGSVIDDGFFQVGIGAYKGEDANVDTVNGVTVNVKNNAKIGSNGSTYAGWIGTGYYDTDTEKTAAMTDAKYVLNIENSIAEFGYLHVSNDGVLNVKGIADQKVNYSGSDYSFYSGDFIINGTATFDATDVLAIFTKVSCDNDTDKPGTLNIINGTYYEAERHNGAVDGNNFNLYKKGIVNVDDAELELCEYTTINTDAVMNIGGKVTALGTITNNGTITLTKEDAVLSANEGLTVGTDVKHYRAGYADGKYTLAPIDYAAYISEDERFETLAEAIAAAKNGDTITLLKDCAENVTVSQAPNVKITIDGNGKTLAGTITVDGKSAGYDTAGLTIKNINFDATNISKDASINLGGNNSIRYTRNVTVEKCTFTGNIADEKAGIKQYTGGCHNVVVTGCTANGMHSLIQLKNVEKGLIITECDVTDCKNGISIGQSTGVKIEDCNITTSGYGIRADGQKSYETTVKNCTINAELPIVVRKVEGDYSLTLEGTNTLTTAGGDNYQVVFTKGDDGTYETPASDPVFVGGANLKVFPETICVAEVGGIQYTSLQDAFDMAQDGDVIELLGDVVIDEKTCQNSGGTWYEGVYYIGDKSFTVDLNGYTVTNTGAVNDYLILLKNDGANANEITFKNGKIEAAPSAYCALCTSTTSTQKITINLENVELVNNNSNGAVAKIRGGAVLNVKDGTVVTGKNSYVGIEAYGATVNIYDGAEIYQNGTSSYVGSLAGVSGNGTINVYGGYGKSAKGGFIAMTSGGTINVYGGKWTANIDGTYAGDNKAVLIAQSEKGASSVINVTGGQFAGGYNCYGDAVGDAQINISGGNFTTNPDGQSYVVIAEGYVSARNNDLYNTYSVVAERSINISADKDIVLARDDNGDNLVTITVKLDGKNMVNAKWTLNYDPEKFVLESCNTVGGNTQTLSAISTDAYKTADGEVFAEDQVLGTYVFKAIAQGEVTETDFTLSSTSAYTKTESHDGAEVVTQNNPGKVTVKLDLIDYVISKKVDDTEVEGDSKDVRYNGTEHSFKVEPIPGATVNYYVNDSTEPVNAVSVKAMGEYKIKYVITAAAGYRAAEGTFTLNIIEPDFVVEVNTKANQEGDYVAGKKIVLVYTDAEDVYFEYDGNIMLDVTKAGYKYVDEEGVTSEHPYKHVYAFVADAIEGGTLADYKKNVGYICSDKKVFAIDAYDANLNFDKHLDLRDITTAYSVNNVDADLFAEVKYQRNILKADITTPDKFVRDNDISKVVTDVMNDMYPKNNQ